MIYENDEKSKAMLSAAGAVARVGTALLLGRFVLAVAGVATGPVSGIVGVAMVLSGAALQKVAVTKATFNPARVLWSGGRTVAHEMVRDGKRFCDPEILRITDDQGWSVAHDQAARNWTTEDAEILRLADQTGWSVAHEMATHGHIFTDMETLKIADRRGLTVAHEQAAKGWVFTDEDVLNLADKAGWTVRQATR